MLYCVKNLKEKRKELVQNKGRNLLNRYTVIPDSYIVNNAVSDESLNEYAQLMEITTEVFWLARSKFDDIIKKIIAIVLLLFAVVLVILSLIAGVFTGGSGTVLGFQVTWWVVLIAVALLVGCAAWADSEEVEKFFTGLRKGADEIGRTVAGLGGSIAKGAADTISDILLSNPIFWIGGGLLCYYLFFTEDEQGHRSYSGPDIVIGSSMPASVKSVTGDITSHGINEGGLSEQKTTHQEDIRTTNSKTGKEKVESINSTNEFLGNKSARNLSSSDSIDLNYDAIKDEAFLQYVAEVERDFNESKKETSNYEKRS